MMKSRLYKALATALLSIIILLITGCSMLVEKDAWDSREEIYEYLSNTYPQISFTVAERYSRGVMSREWKVTSPDYPGMEFNVSNHMVTDGVTFVPNFKATGHSDNIYQEIFTYYKEEFMKTVKDLYGEEARGLWNLEDEGQNRVGISFKMDQISQLNIVEQMTLDFENGWVNYSKGMKPGKIYLHMDIENAISRHGVEPEGIYWEITDLTTESFEQDFRDGLQAFSDDIVEYSVINSLNAVGVDDGMKWQYLEKLKGGELPESGQVKYAIIDNGDRVPFLAKQSWDDQELLLTRGSFLALCLQEGLSIRNVDAYYHSFTVVGHDGREYEFVPTYDFENREEIEIDHDYIVDGVPQNFSHGNSHFEVDFELIRMITGVQLEVEDIVG